MLAFLKLVPIREYFYAAIAIAAVTYYNVHVHNLVAAAAHRQEAAVAIATQKTLRAAKAALDAKDAAYKQALAKQDAIHAQDLQARDDAHAADIARLRQLAAGNRNQDAGVGSSPGTSTGSGSVSDSAGSLGYVPAELGAQLADALRTTRDQRDLCYAERDSLTGK